MPFDVKLIEIYLHLFVLQRQSSHELHGRALAIDRFRGRFLDYPDVRFIEWHYNQCVKARIRGFAVGMKLSEQ